MGRPAGSRGCMAGYYGKSRKYGILYRLLYPRHCRRSKLHTAPIVQYMRLKSQLIAGASLFPWPPGNTALPPAPLP